MTTSRYALLLPIAIGLAACDAPAATNAAATNEANAAAVGEAPTNTPAAATGNGADASNSSEAAGSAFTATATFSGFVQGDYLYADFGPIKGHEAEGQPMVESGELGAFLVAHKGKPIEVKIETVNKFMDPPGEKIDVTRLVDASVGGESAAAWWAKLTPAEQKAAQKAADDLAAASVS